MVEVEHLYASKPFTSEPKLITCNTQVQLGNKYPQDHPDCKLWRVTFLRSLPPAGLDSHPAMPKAHPRKKGSWADDWSSDSDSDGSYTIVKTITKTKKVSSKRRGGKRERR